MAITFGSSAPSQITKNFEALIATSLAHYSKTLVDNISSSNAFLYELKKRGLINLIPGSLYIAEDLMYALAQFDAYDGYDELSDTPMDGITQVQFEWRQGSVPISYSEKERKMNKTRIVDLIKSKIKQAELGFMEGFNKALLLGSLSQPTAGTDLQTPFTSAATGAAFIDPLPRLIAYDPTASLSVGNINQSTYTWWRNRKKEATATTYTTFLLEMDNLMNTCNRGGGKGVNLIIMDQTSYELLNAAYYYKYRTMAGSNSDYPFENIKFRGATVVWDEYMPDVFSGTASTATYGTAYFINSDYISLKVEEDTNFQMTEFAKPPKGDSRLAHILFMGQTTINNRRKHGVYGKIPRTLTAS